MKKILSTNQKPNFFGKQCRENVVSNSPRVKPEYRNYDTIDEAWILFFDDRIIKRIVTCINQSTREKAAGMNESTKESTETTHLYDTSEREIKAFIGLWYLRETLNWTFHQVRTAFSSIYSNKLFFATMYVSRFVFLFSCLRFDDIRSLTERF